MQNISLFLRINFFITTLIYLSFLTFNQNDTPLTLLFTILAVISTSATLYLIIYLLFRLLFRFSTVMNVVLSIIFFLVNFSLIIDFIIFKVWKFHINAMVINIITSPAAWDSLHLDISALVIVTLIIVTLIVGKYFLYQKIKNTHHEKVASYNRSFNRVIIPIVLIMIVVEKISFGMADVYNKETILESTKPIPLYQPLTFSRFVEKTLGIKAVKKETSKHTIKKNSKVKYPLHPITIAKDAKSPHVFIFMFDAARNSILSETVSPNIMHFSQEALVYQNHISGGNATRFGIFSLLYGLNSTYWFNFLNASKEPVFFDVLKKKEYQIKIISSTSTKWPEFKQTVYCGVTECIVDNFEGTPHQKDAQSTLSFKNWLTKTDTNNPIFSLVFLDAPHGFSYPQKYEKFKPNAGNEGLNYLDIEKENKEVFINSYKNAVHYNDALFGEMIGALKEKGIYEDSIIIFTSDHGEEFFEYGFFGHNSAFSKAQINSPFMMKLPGVEAKNIAHMTSHLDVPATLLKQLGVENPAEDYSCGLDMLDKNYSRKYSYIAKWNKNAIITDKNTYIYSNLPNEIFKSEIRENSSYKKVSQKGDDNIEHILLEVLNQNRRFIQ